ncbi:MAG TPA: PilZ domain-containing protein, partial [Candidatus Nitrosotenuis sp.]|nr:PilZ domain-containing protein [Candidatus Nitrosotenuis sp.]
MRFCVPAQLLARGPGTVAVQVADANLSGLRVSSPVRLPLRSPAALRFPDGAPGLVLALRLLWERRMRQDGGVRYEYGGSYIDLSPRQLARLCQSLLGDPAGSRLALPERRRTRRLEVPPADADLAVCDLSESGAAAYSTVEVPPGTEGRLELEIQGQRLEFSLRAVRCQKLTRGRYLVGLQLGGEAPARQRLARLLQRPGSPLRATLTLQGPLPPPEPL